MVGSLGAEVTGAPVPSLGGIPKVTGGGAFGLRIVDLNGFGGSAPGTAGFLNKF